MLALGEKYNGINKQLYERRYISSYVEIIFETGESNVLKSVLCKEKVELIDVLQRIDIGNHKCRLGFTPHDDDMNICISEMYDGGNDYRLFYKGKGLESIEQDKLYFPDLSHA